MSDLKQKNLREYSRFTFTPANWTECAVEDICSLGRGRVISQEEINQSPGSYPVYSSQTRNEGKMGSIATYDFFGDYVTWTTDGENAGTVFYRTGKFNCTNVCGTLLPKHSTEVSPLFLSYHLSRVTKRYVSYIGNPKLMNGVMASIGLILPPKNIQDKIEIILQTIDRAIESTQALIEKYQLIKAGLMHDLFTRGIGADGKLRPPREEAPELYQETAIGWIPKEWEVKPILAYANVIDPNPSHRNPVYHPEGFPFISTIEFEDFDRIELDTSRRVIEAIVLEQEFRCQFNKHSIAFSRKGTIGETRFLPDHIRFALLDSLCVINPKSIDAFFLFYALRSYILKRQIKNMTVGQALPQMSIGRVRELVIATPINESEQQNVVARLKKIDDFLSEANQSLEKLRKQKAGLMQDLLTGKVQVKVEEDQAVDGL